jgi:hypothetical protein
MRVAPQWNPAVFFRRRCASSLLQSDTTGNSYCVSYRRRCLPYVVYVHLFDRSGLLLFDLPPRFLILIFILLLLPVLLREDCDNSREPPPPPPVREEAGVAAGVKLLPLETACRVARRRPSPASPCPRLPLPRSRARFKTKLMRSPPVLVAALS